MCITTAMGAGHPLGQSFKIKNRNIKRNEKSLRRTIICEISEWAGDYMDGKRLGRITNNILRCLIVIMGVAMFAAVVLGVFFRYVLNNPLAWTTEVATYLLIWSTLIGTYYVQRENAHVRMTFIVDKLSGRPRRIVNIIGNMAVLVFLVVMGKEGWVLATKMARIRTPALRISMSIPFLSIPVAALLMGVLCVISIGSELIEAVADETRQGKG